MMKKIYLYSLLCFVMTSCYQDFDLESYRTVPKIVMNGCAVAGAEEVIVRLGESWFVTDTPRTESLSGALVDVYINDVPCGRLQYAINERYKAPCPKLYPGDRIRVEVSAEGFPDAKAEATVPSMTPLTDVCINPEKTDDGYVNIKISGTFTDQPGVKNYYGIMVLKEDAYWSSDDTPIFSPWPMDIYKKDEPLFDSSSSIIDDMFMGEEGHAYTLEILPFTDEKIDGQTYTFHLRENNGLSRMKMECCDSLEMVPPLLDENNKKTHDYIRCAVLFYSLSEEYYNQLHTKEIWGKDDLATDGFSQPMKSYTNVTGGLGYWGAYNCYKTEYTYIKTTYN